jgi:hypothetical protein
MAGELARVASQAAHDRETAARKARADAAAMAAATEAAEHAEQARVAAQREQERAALKRREEVERHEAAAAALEAQEAKLREEAAGAQRVAQEWLQRQLHETEGARLALDAESGRAPAFLSKGWLALHKQKWRVMRSEARRKREQARTRDAHDRCGLTAVRRVAAQSALRGAEVARTG